jgi:hypothetical protein
LPAFVAGVVDVGHVAFGVGVDRGADRCEELRLADLLEQAESLEPVLHRVLEESFIEIELRIDGGRVHARRR